MPRLSWSLVAPTHRPGWGRPIRNCDAVEASLLAVPPPVYVHSAGGVVDCCFVRRKSGRSGECRFRNTLVVTRPADKRCVAPGRRPSHASVRIDLRPSRAEEGDTCLDPGDRVIAGDADSDVDRAGHVTGVMRHAAVVPDEDHLAPDQPGALRKGGRCHLGGAGCRETLRHRSAGPCRTGGGAGRRRRGDNCRPGHQCGCARHEPRCPADAEESHACSISRVFVIGLPAAEHRRDHSGRRGLAPSNAAAQVRKESEKKLKPQVTTTGLLCRGRSVACADPGGGGRTRLRKLGGASSWSRPSRVERSALAGFRFRPGGDHSRRPLISPPPEHLSPGPRSEPRLVGTRPAVPSDGTRAGHHPRHPLLRTLAVRR